MSSATVVCKPGSSIVQLNFGDNVMYVDHLFHHLVVHHCDLETLCIAGHRAGHKFLCICQFVQCSVIYSHH